MIETSSFMPTKKALVIGIRYKCFDGKSGKEKLLLAAPHKDVLAFHGLLTSEVYGYKRENIQVLIDTDEKFYLDAFGLTLDRDHAPTKDNIIEAMEDMIATGKSGDRFVLYFTGHGGQVNDLNGDEIDGLDEILWPSDIMDPLDKNRISNYVLDDASLRSAQTQQDTGSWTLLGYQENVGRSTPSPIKIGDDLRLLQLRHHLKYVGDGASAILPKTSPSAARRTPHPISLFDAKDFIPK
ncbi:hypothetical protein NLI96_g805 [Meripilus lineatus]|uniref:Peptidase C14 caspase domain-containing protein n=1 Tax=Meripilus lineatus TaxID=2056292 RepID=A0AAD5VBM4_9APHY|nr:hypothetical protein NLI96_g805 [Physisporinus lineatus]